LGSEDTETTAFDHGRAAHTDARALSCDDHVAATEQRRVAGETKARHDADGRDKSRQPTEGGEGHDVKAGDGGAVGVTRPAATSLCEEHGRQAEPLDQLEQAVLLAVVHLTLGAGENRVVVRENRHGGALSEEVAVDPADAGDEAVGRRAPQQPVELPPASLSGGGGPAVLVERTRVKKVLDVLACGPPAGAAPALDGLRTVLVGEERLPGKD